MPQYWCIHPPTSHKSLQHRHLSSLSARVCRDSNVACGVLCTLNTWLSWHYTCYVFARWQVYFLSIVQKIFIQVWSPNVNACIISRINLVHCQRYIIRFITLPERDLVSSIIMLFCSALEDAHPRLFHHSFLSSFVISFLLFFCNTSCECNCFSTSTTFLSKQLVSVLDEMCLRATCSSQHHRIILW